MKNKSSDSFSAKHPADTRVDDNILEALKPHIRKGKITCADAHDVAGRINVSTHQVGIAIDLGEIRITACQLGLFGVSGSADAGTTTAEVSQKLEPIIRGSLEADRLSCRQAWDIAQAHGVTRMQVGKISDAMGIRISQCQLGAF